MRLVRSTRTGKERQIREVQAVDEQAFHPPGEKPEWGTSELPEDICSFLSYGGRVPRFVSSDGKTIAVVEYVSLPKLLRIMRRYRERFKPYSALRAFTANEALLRKVRADYAHVPQNRFFYVHGIARLPDKAFAGQGEKLMQAFTANLDKRKPYNLAFGYLDCRRTPNERSLRISLRNGYVIDDFAQSVFSPGDLHVRVVRPPVRPQTIGAEKFVQIAGGEEFFEKTKKLLSQGFIGVRFDGKTRSVVFQRLRTP